LLPPLAGTNIQSGEEVAIKLESIKTRHPQLLYESKLYKILQGGGACPPPLNECLRRKDKIPQAGTNSHAESLWRVLEGRVHVMCVGYAM